MVVQVASTDKVSESIEKYRSKSGNNDVAIFAFSGRNLDKTLTISQAYLFDGSVISVITTSDEQGV